MTYSGKKNATKKSRHQQRELCPNDVILSGNRSAIVLDDLFNVTRVFEKTNVDPTIVRKRKNCVCHLPVCKCSGGGDPENWYVKTFLTKEDRMVPSGYYISSQRNSTDHFRVKCPEVGPSLDGRKLHSPKILGPLKPKYGIMANEKESTTMENQENKPRRCFQCSPASVNKIRRDLSTNVKTNFCCECLECKFQSHKDIILLKCSQCGPFYRNKPNVPINYSKLLPSRKNRLKMKVKYLQVS
ncbi:hypothetical protein RUM44_005275 [Polyplax serrata]|uniref:Uncharacterized protein n=1 Tax=Polyplax serrata TaxID=468196 RepID=A0ABR1AEJ6_POLSC